MTSILNSLSGVFSCMIMIGLGYYLTGKRWFDERISRLFSRLAMVVTIPLFMITSMMKSYKKEDLLHLGLAVVLPFVTMLLTYAIGFVTSLVMGIPEHRRGSFRAMFFVANTAFIGFPVIAALFGEAALPYAVMYYLVQSILFWTLGAYGLSLDGPKMEALGVSQPGAERPPRPRLLSLQTVKNIMTPPLLGAFAAILLILWSVRLPQFAATTFQYLGGMTTPLSMLFIGIAIYLVNLRSVKITRDMVVLAGARFLVAPFVALAVLAFVPTPDLLKKVIVIEAAMPVMTQVGIAAKAYRADAGYVSVMTALTTVLAMFTIPTYFLLLRFNVL